jgi:hypothetical protein
LPTQYLVSKTLLSDTEFAVLNAHSNLFLLFFFHSAGLRGLWVFAIVGPLQLDAADGG